MIKDINYGRLKPIRNGQWFRRNGKPNLVDVSFWIPDTVPAYASGSFLYFEADGEPYKIYNPLRIHFDVNVLVSQIKTFFNKAGATASEFQIVQVD